MRGSLRKRYKDSWNIIIDLGYQPDPTTGTLKRKQKWYTVRGTKRDAEKKLAELLHQVNRNELIEPTKLTLGQWLEEWLDTAIKPPNQRWLTYRTYASILHQHLGPALGSIRLQQLQPTDLQRYYTTKAQTLASSSLAQHHAMLSAALSAAQQHGLVVRNVAKLVAGKPRQHTAHHGAVYQCWTADEARSFLAVVQAADPQTAAFYTLALDSGVRKGELCGLRWEDVDLKAGTITIVQQLLKGSLPPRFGTTKNGKPRTVLLAPKTVELLRRRKAHQAAVKMANRQHYQEYGLVFARDWESGYPQTVLGMPLSLNNIGHPFQRLTMQAGARRFTIHGLRHTCATLLLQAGVPVHVVQERLGHKRVEMTLGIYAHALPAMQQDAAAKLAALIQP
jgi:integrase